MAPFDKIFPGGLVKKCSDDFESSEHVEEISLPGS